MAGTRSRSCSPTGATRAISRGSTSRFRPRRLKPPAEPFDEDQAALRLAAAGGAALCTIVGIEGSFSRRLGAQLAVAVDGRMAGSLADGCLERELATQAAEARREGRPRLLR